MTEIEVAFLKQRIEELEKTLRLAQSAMATAARNALTSLDEGDEEEVRNILHSMAGEE